MIIDMDTAVWLEETVMGGFWRLPKITWQYLLLQTKLEQNKILIDHTEVKM